MTLYTARTEFKPSGLVGISDKQIDEHWKLYEGYVKQTNTLKDELKALREAGKGTELMYADRRRRLGFEMGGMVGHEYYFANLKAGVSDSVAPEFKKLMAEKFGNFENWMADFSATAATRGVGWAVCAYDATTGDVNNHFIELHSEGHLPGFEILAIMDVWEHAFLLDYLPTERAKYIEAFRANINWERLEERTQKALSQKASLRF
jgi:Fe-Mn family superoxide dismutase